MHPGLSPRTRSDPQVLLLPRFSSTWAPLMATPLPYWPNPDPTNPPWCYLPARTREALWKAGYTTPDAIAKLGGRQLRAIPGVGPAGARAVRKIWPDPTGRPGKRPKKRVPVHGHGQLMTGDNLANRGGGAGMTARIRALASLEFGERIPRLAQIADDQLGDVCDACGRGAVPVTVSEMIRAIGELAKYGVGRPSDTGWQLDFERAKGFVRRLAEGVARHVKDEATQVAVSEEFKAVVREFFPRP